MIDWYKNACLADVMSVSMERLKEEDPYCAVSAHFSVYEFMVLVTTDRSHIDGITRILREWLDNSGMYIPLYVDRCRRSGLWQFQARLVW